MNKKIAIIAAILSMCFSSVSLPYERAAILHGTVRDYFGNPIEEVEVTVEHNNTFAALTDRNGEYSVHYGPGTFTVSYSKPGYTRQEVALCLPSEERFPMEDIIVCRVPKEKGVYWYNQDNLVPLKENKMGEIGSKFRLSENYTIEKTPIFLIYGDDVDDVFLTRLHLRNPQVAKPYELKRSTFGENIAVLEVNSPLEPGVYMVQWRYGAQGYPDKMGREIVHDFEITTYHAIAERHTTSILYNKWVKWQKGMEADFARLEQLDTRDELQPAEKIKVWAEFLSEYSEGNPYTTKDNDMRRKAKANRSYWKSVLGYDVELFQMELARAIKKNWSYPVALLNGKKGGIPEAVVIITVRRDGKIVRVGFKEQSKDPVFNDSVLKAIERSDPLPKFPPSYGKSCEEVEIHFSLKDMIF
jgi:hypothetical protein